MASVGSTNRGSFDDWITTLGDGCKSPIPGSIHLFRRKITAAIGISKATHSVAPARFNDILHAVNGGVSSPM